MLLMFKLLIEFLLALHVHVPPFRWGVWVASKMLQTMLCVQVVFWGATIFKIAWSLTCICLCFLVDVVEDQASRATMGAVINRIYF